MMAPKNSLIINEHNIIGSGEISGVELQLKSGFSILREEFIKALTSRSLDVSLLEERSKDSVDRSNKLLEDIISPDTVPSKSSVDSWNSSFKQFVNVDLSYILKETDRFKICIPSIMGVPFESRESLKTLQLVMKRAEQSKSNIGSIRRSAVGILDRASRLPVDDMNFENYESLCSTIEFYQSVDSGSCSIGVKEILGRESDNDILSRALKLKEEFEALSRDDTLEFNNLIRLLKQRRAQYDVEKKKFTTGNFKGLDLILDLLDGAISSYDKLKLPQANREELQKVVNPFIDDVKSLRDTLKSLYESRGAVKKDLKSSIKEVLRYEWSISSVINDDASWKYSVFNLEIVEEFQNAKKLLDVDNASNARKIDEVSCIVNDYDAAKKKLSSTISRISDVFNKDFKEMLELYQDRLINTLSITPNADIRSLHSRILNEMRYLEPVMRAGLPVSDECKNELKGLFDRYTRRKDEIEFIVSKKTEISMLEDSARSENELLRRLRVDVDYNNLQRTRESLEEFMKKKSTITSRIEEKREEYKTIDDKNKKPISSGKLLAYNFEISNFVNEEFSSAHREISKLEGNCRKKMLDFRDFIQTLLINFDNDCPREEYEVRLVLIENALIPLKEYVDCESQISLVKKKKESITSFKTQDVHQQSVQSGNPYCLESAISKIPVPDFKMQEFQSILIGDNINNYLGRMKEYISKIDKVGSSKLTSSQKSFFGEVSIVLNRFGHSSTCANLEDGSYIMDVVFRARDASARLGKT